MINKTTFGLLILVALCAPAQAQYINNKALSLDGNYVEVDSAANPLSLSSQVTLDDWFNTFRQVAQTHRHRLRFPWPRQGKDYAFADSQSMSDG